MTPAEARNAIVSRYLTEFNGQFPIAIDNREFEAPETPEKWTRIAVRFSSGNQSSLGQDGNRKFEKRGLVFIQVFTPSGEGTDNNDSLAKLILDLMDGERLDNLWLFNGRINTIGNDGAYFQQNIILDFTFEEIR